MQKEKKATVYSDGACNPNPGPGGWAAVITFPDRKPEELVGSEFNTTSNRMELTAALQALQHIPQEYKVVIYTDSKYLKKGITEWLRNWQKKNWQTAEKTAVKNRELWEQLAEEIQRRKVIWNWTKGHAGNTWNERADFLARSAIESMQLPLDEKNVVHVFAAASFLGKDDCGGWAVLLKYGENSKTLSGSERGTTGNQMHIRSAIEGLKALKKNLPVYVYTSSSYLKDGATFWLDKWQKGNWLTKDRKPVLNRALWEELAKTMQSQKVNWFPVAKDKMPDEMKQAKDLATRMAYERSQINP